MKIILVVMFVFLSACETKHEITLSGNLTINLNVDKAIDTQKDIFGFGKKEGKNVK